MKRIFPKYISYQSCPLHIRPLMLLPAMDVSASSPHTTRVADSTPEHVQHCLEVLNDWDCELQHNCNFSTYLYGHILDPQKMLTKLNTCNCCRKHRVDRPEKLDIWTNTTFNNTQDPDCQCACRHTARYVCRAFKGEKG